jgi:hypothetical protein
MWHNITDEETEDMWQETALTYSNYFLALGWINPQT